jgi:Ca2+-binding RTX toxin-like protein
MLPATRSATPTGNTGNNTLNGGTGADTMIGAAGNDTYVVDNAGDIVSEAASAGFDTVQSGVTHTLGSNIEYLTLTGAAATNGTGNTLNNWLQGNGAVNTLDGGAGNDTLWGADGNDTLFGNTGNDLLQGGLGNDTLTARRQQPARRWRRTPEAALRTSLRWRRGADTLTTGGGATIAFKRETAPTS